MQRITRKNLLNTNTNNTVLMQAKEEKLNFPGYGGIQQFIKDCVERGFKVNGFEHLGMARQYIEARKQNEDFAEEVKTILGKIMGVQNVNAIIDAHSQHPASLIANTLSAACLSSRLIIGQCPLAKVNFIKEGDEIYQVITAPYMPIIIIEPYKQVLIPGPLTAKFKLMPAKSNYPKPYYQFESLETANADLAKMARGELIDDQELLNLYDNPQVQALTQGLIQQYQEVEKLQDVNSVIQAKYNIASQDRRGEQQEATQTINVLQDKLSKMLDQQSRWLQEFSQLTTDFNAKNAKQMALAENIQRLEKQVEALALNGATNMKELTESKNLLQAQKDIAFIIQNQMNRLQLKLKENEAKLEAANNKILDLQREKAAAIALNDEKRVEIAALEAEKNRIANLNADLRNQLSAERNHPYTLAREAQVSGVMINDCIDALDNYINHLKSDIPARKLVTYSDDASFFNLARGINQQDHGNYFSFSSLQALKKIRSCLILKDTLLQKNKSNADKAWDLGVELKRNDHTALLESSRTSALGTALKIVLAPFTLFASLFTYRSKECKKAQKAMHQLFKPIEATLDDSIRHIPGQRVR